MKTGVVDDLLVRRFLLGDISQQEKEEVEERAFLDSEFFEHLQAAEDDLIDDYLYGDLSSKEKERFKKYFLPQPGRYEALRIAKALQRHISPSGARAPSTVKVIPDSLPKRTSFLDFLKARSLAFRFSVAAAILLIVTAGVWIVTSVLRQQGNPAPVEARQSNQSAQPPKGSQNSQPNKELQGKADQASQEQNQTSSNKAPEPQSVTASSEGRKEDERKPVSSPKRSAAPAYAVLLMPAGPVRGESEVIKVKLPPNARQAILQLPLIEGTRYLNYQATLTTDNQRVVRTWPRLKSTASESGKIVAIKVPVNLLSSDQHYRVMLSGISSEGTVREIRPYYFQVLK